MNLTLMCGYNSNSDVFANDHCMMIIVWPIAKQRIIMTVFGVNDEVYFMSIQKTKNKTHITDSVAALDTMMKSGKLFKMYIVTSGDKNGVR